MKGNMMMRLISLMILIPAALAHLSGQIDLTEPTWFWLTIFAGLNALQTSITGWCPACNLFNSSKDKCATGSCSIPADNASQSSDNNACCATELKSEKSSGCCTPATENNSECCSDSNDCISIKVLGTDTAYSEATANLVESTAKELDIKCCVAQVEETKEITDLGFDAKTGLVIKGHLVHTGVVPSKNQLTDWLQPQTACDDSPSGCCGSCS